MKKKKKESFVCKRPTTTTPLLFFASLHKRCRDNSEKRERAKIALPACHVGPEDCRSHDGCKVALDKENEKTRIMRSQEKEKAFAGPGQQASHTHTLMMQFVIKGV